MPKLLDLYGYSVEMYFNDHPPPHCHVRGHGGRAKFRLNCQTGPVEVMAKRGISNNDQSALERGLNANLALLCSKWGNLP